MNYSLNYTKILLSALTIAFVAALVFGGTQAFFNDEETSEGNLFTAGALDLKVDSVAHFNGLICDGDTWEIPEGGSQVGPEHFPQPGDPCTGTWEETDLGIEHRFFDFDDLKPGDEGENTISLHVYDNDAWGCFYVEDVEDNDNGITEPEGEGENGDTTDGPGNGELGEYLTFDSWLDEGAVPGFQCNNPGANPVSGASCDADLLEGDNILNGVEQLFWTDETVDEASEGPFNQSDVLAAAYAAHSCTEGTGNTAYGECHGLAEDGRMVGSVTYYWGLAWSIPAETGNIIQTDSIVTDMIFTATQHRNNEDFTCPVLDDEEPEAEVSTSDTWSPVDLAGKVWFAKARNNNANFELAIGTNDAGPEQNTAEATWVAETVYNFTLAYDGVGSATLTVEGESPVTYAVGAGAFSRIGINAKAQDGGETTVDNLSLNTVAPLTTDNVTATGSGSNDVESLTIESNTLGGAWELTGTFSFSSLAGGSQEYPAVQFSID